MAVISSSHFFVLLLFFISGVLRIANGQARGQGAWCTPKPSTSDHVLLNNINYVCGIVNCSIIQKYGPCFYPTTLMNHASVVMNLYYQKEGRHYWNCNFTNSAVITVTDPSYGKCKFEYRRSGDNV